MKLVIKNLSKNYGTIQALKSVTCTLEEGVYGLLGPNGAGKTTLMKCVSSVMQPTNGRIYYDNNSIYEMDRSYRSILGYMPQQQNIYGEYTGRMFLRYISSLKGLKKNEAKKRIEYLLEKYNLDSVAHRKISEYSGGMKQRLLIVQALLNDPKILLLDEPTAGVDPDERIRMRNHISELGTSRIVLFSTHIVSDLISTSNEIILLKKGEIVIKGNANDITQIIEDITYEINCEMTQLQSIKEQYKVLTVTNLGKTVKVRFLSEIHPSIKGVVQIAPTVEDAYLYYMSNEG